MKTLYLVRHAKSSWKDSALSDLQRPLNNRGIKNAPEMGVRLNLMGTRLDLIISSPAKRAFTTATMLAQVIDYKLEAIVKDDRLYFENVASMIKIIQKTKPAIQSLMLVGHNPDMTTLFNKICGFQTDNMPTCAIATIQLEQEWKDITKHSGTLIDYDFPKRID